MDSLSKIIDSRIEHIINLKWTLVPGVVIRKVSSIEYVIRSKVKVGDNTAPRVVSVPIAVPKSGNTYILIPPKVGDVVLIGFSKYALDELLDNTNENTVDDPRRFNYTDAIILGGFFLSFDTAPDVGDGEVLINHESGSSLKIDNNGDVVITGTVLVNGGSTGVAIGSSTGSETVGDHGTHVHTLTTTTSLKVD